MPKSSFGTMDECRTCSIRQEGTLNTDVPNAIYKVRISTAAMGTRRISIVTLTPEVLDGVLRLVLSGYRELMDIQAESWSLLYRYPVANGIRLAMIITLAKHIPLHTTMTGHRVLMAFDGQPMACYGCNARFTFIRRALCDGD